MTDPRPTLSPHVIGQYFNLQSCQMYLTWTYDDEARAMIDSLVWEPSSKSPLLMGEGINFELRQLKAIPQSSHTFVVPSDTEWEEYDELVGESGHLPRSVTTEKVQTVVRSDLADDSVVLYQPRLTGTIGAYEVRGDADIVLLRPTTRTDTVDVVVFEVKNSDEQKVSHRFQAAIYASLVQEAVSDAGHRIGELETYVLTQENNVIDRGLLGLEDFEFRPYLGKLNLLLGEGKEFDDILLETPYEETDNRIDSRCSGCDFEPLCVSRAANTKGLELLGLDESTQRTLEDIPIDGGVTDIEDFALLFDQPGNDSSHTDYEALTPRNDELVQLVRERTDISDLQEQSQIAYHFLTELDWDYSTQEDRYAHHLQGAGYNLPWNDHNVDTPDFDDEYQPDYPQESLIQIYLYVQHDHALGKLSLMSALVGNAQTGEAIPVTEVIEEITPDDRLNQEGEEHKLLKRFFTRLGGAIASVAPDLTSDGFDAGDGFPHVYIFSDHQREKLVAALRRHEDVYGASAVQKLLGLRPGIDQKMVSVLQQEFRERQAFRFAGLGLVQATAHYYDSGTGEWFDWIAERDDGSEIRFPRVFSRGFFDACVRHDDPGGGIELDHSRRPELDAAEYNYSEWVYPIEHRESDQIPAEYLWGVYDMLSPDEAADPDLVRDYLYRDDSHSEEITLEDLTLFAEQICEAIAHIESSTWNKDRSTPKAPLDVSAFTDIEFDERTLAEAVREYQQLEFRTNRDGKEAYYRRPLTERVAGGEALLVKNTDGEILDADEPGRYPDAYIEGPLLRSLDEEYDPDTHDAVAASPLARSANDWCVTVEVEDDNPPESLHGSFHNPTNLQHGATTILEELDAERGWMRGFVMGGWPRGNAIDERYCVWHYDWTDEYPAEDNQVYVEEPPSDPEDARTYVVDPGLDQITQSRAAAALEPDRITENVVYTRLEQVYRGERETLSIAGYPDRYVGRYINAMSYFDPLAERPGPNADQIALIEDTEHAVVLLQGPPGTGKTKYTLAPAALSRVHAATATGENFLGCLSAVSHDAVTEALTSVAELREQCPPTDEALDLIRICSSSGQEIDHGGVENVVYHELSEDELRAYYDDFIDRDATDSSPALLAGTPASLYRFVDKMAEAGADSDAGTLMETRNARLFDLAIVDEASMMDLPPLFLITAFLDEEGQTILVGDHRQMEPIQQHSWEREDRITIERNQPFLSALNFLRFLRSDIDESEFLRASPPDLADPDATIPMHQLTITYRLPEPVARMHTDLYYAADGIELTSRADHDPLPDVRPDVDAFLEDVVDPDAPISLLEHFDDSGEKENPVEAALIQELLGPYTVVEADPDADEVTAGVVVPYNRHKRLLNEELDDAIQVDTVEKFQGRERNLIIVSAASADPNYLNRIAEFLLNPNRFNVAKSRMMQKLIIIAGDSVFQTSSPDIDGFEDQTPWIEFYGHMGGFGPTRDAAVAEIREIVGAGPFDRIVDRSHVDPSPGVAVRKLVGYDPGFDFSEIGG